MTKKDLVILIPVYNEASALEANFKVIYDQLKKDGIVCRYLLIDDGSADETWLTIQKLAEDYKEISGISFARNFGKEMALSAGLDAIDGDLFLFMDSDLQHPPSCIKQMLEKLEEEEADIVEGIKSSRGKESLKYKLIAKNFYKLLKSLTHLDMDNSSDFKVMTRDVVEEIRRFREHNVFFRGVVHWVGFKKVQMPFAVEERTNGTSNFSTFKLMQLAMNAIMSYTSSPLYIIIGSGAVFLVFAILLGIQTFYNYMMGYSVSGFSTVILLLLFIGSLLMISIGIIGVYVSRIYDEVKGRPRYIVNKRIGEGLSEQ